MKKKKMIKFKKIKIKKNKITHKIPNKYILNF